MLRRSSLLAVLFVLAASSPAFAVREPAGDGLTALDTRSADRTPVTQRTRDAREALDGRLGAFATVSTDPVSGGLRTLGRTDGFLTSADARDPAVVALDYVRGQAAVFGLDGPDLDALELTARYRSRDGVTHLTWVQTSRGVRAYDSTLSVNVADDGRIINASGAPVHNLDLSTTTPVLTADSALAAARASTGARAAGAGDRARLVAFAAPDSDRLAWQVTVPGAPPYVYDVVVDAGNGDILARRTVTSFAIDADAYDFRPQGPAPFGARSVDLTPWLNAGATTLTGPNAHAYADVNDDDVAGPSEEIGPSGAGSWRYPVTPVAPGATQSCSPFTAPLLCTWDGVTAASEVANRAQATVQTFVAANRFHDWLLGPTVGFDRASHNFEAGGPGGSDPVLAEADDGQGSGPNVNNADFSTPPDGQSPRMQMYLFRNPYPAGNGSDDQSIVYHEYTHGLSGRLVGNGLGNGLTKKQPQAMGEGWSDFYGLDYLVASGQVTDGPGAGDVVEGASSTGNPNRGIRRNAVDCPVGSADAVHCPGGSGGSGPGGFSLGDMGKVGVTGSQASGDVPRFEVHDDGEIWVQTLWDLRTALGADRARTLITNAMRLSPVNPTFLDERDAILQADLATGGTSHDEIWRVFAARGFGYGAYVSGPGATRATESFALPGAVAARAPVVDDAVPIGDGDGVPEPGETVRLGIGLTNPGVAALTGVQVTLSTQTPGVLVGQPRAAYPDVSPGQTRQAITPLALTLPPTLACDSRVLLQLAVVSDQGSVTLPVELALGSGAQSYANATPVAIPDVAGNNPANTAATSRITVPGGAPIRALRVRLNVSHSWVGDLLVRLTSPDGQSLELIERPGVGRFGSSATGLSDVLLDDAAATSIQDIPSSFDVNVVFPPVTGSWRPNEALSGLAGQTRGGEWTLRLIDKVTGDTGSLGSWALDFDTPTCSTAAFGAPAAMTGTADGVTHASATLTGTVTPSGVATASSFEYGPTAEYGSASAAADVGDTSAAVPTSAVVQGLAATTTYHYRTVATRGGVVVAAGEDRTFTTTAPPPDAGRGLVLPPVTASTPIVRRAVARASTNVRLNRRRAFAFAFTATPTRAKGTVSFTARAVKGRRRPSVMLGKRSFTVPASGRVTVLVMLSPRTLGRLQAAKASRVTAAFVLDGKVLRTHFTLRTPRAPRRGA